MEHVVGRHPRRPWFDKGLGLGAGALLVALASAYLAYHYMIDLDVYRKGAWALLHGRDPYGSHLPGPNLEYTYTPFSTLVFVPLDFLPHRVAQGVDAAVSMLALWFVVHQVVRRLLPSDRARLVWWGAVAVTTVACWSEPVRKTLMYGQVNIVLMLLIVVDLLLLQKTRLAGVLIGIAAGIKLTPVVYIAYLFFTGRRRAAGQAAAAAVGTVVVGWVLLPHPTKEYFTRYMFDTTRIGNLSYAANQSLNGFVARLFHSNTLGHPVWLLVAGATAVIGLWAAVRTRELMGELAGLAVCAVTGLLVSPISWNHHWVWWVLPALILAREAWTRRSAALTAAAVAWTSMFYLAPFWMIPSHLGRELHQHGIQLILGSAYVVAAMVGLAVVVGLILTSSSRSSHVAAPTSGHELDPTDVPGLAVGNAGGRSVQSLSVKVAVNTAPPSGSFDATTRPWWRRAMSSTIDSPSPDPGAERASVDR